MVWHTCPVCRQRHAVREARATVAHGRQLTCSPDCEAEGRRRMRCRPAQLLVAAEPKRPAKAWQWIQASTARVMHVWVVASARADLTRAAVQLRRTNPSRD